MTSPETDPRRCPLCGDANECGMAEGARTCWCFTEGIAREVLERVPDEARDLACVCRACASGRRNPAKTLEQLEGLLRRR